MLGSQNQSLYILKVTEKRMLLTLLPVKTRKSLVNTFSNLKVCTTQEGVTLVNSFQTKNLYTPSVSFFL